MGGGDKQSSPRSELMDLLNQDPATQYLAPTPTPTPRTIGDQPHRIIIGDLVHRYESSGKPEKGYSDEYSKKRIEEQKKQMDQLMNALSRLGIMDQLIPKEMPRVPYRPFEEEFGF